MEEINIRLLKENTKLYKKLQLSKLQIKNSSPQSQAHHKLETLIEVAMSICYPKASCDAATLPNPIQVEEKPKGQH